VQPNAARRLELARRQGLSLERALSTMLYDVAVDGHEIRVGDYQVAYAVEYAEGFWYPHGEGLTYHYGAEESTRHNAHVEVAVRDVATGRLLTELPITATLLFEKKMLGSKQEWLMWHPWLYHYGRNWRVPHGGTYGLRVELGPPRCNLRFDLGAYPEPRSVVVDFDRVQIEPGQK
jgi:hypothetical protein